MEEIYMNVEYDKSVHSRSSTNQTGPRSSERRFYRPVVLCLGLLSVFLLTGLIGLRVHYYNSECGAAAELSTIKANMTEVLQDSKNKVSSLTREKDQLNVKLSSLTREKDQLNARLIEMTKDRDRLESLSKTSCPAGWTKFGWSCYIVSSGSDSWTNGRRDCQNRGADLVVINSAEEQKFLSGFSDVDTWIGLSDRDEEGTWKWVDGTPLTLQYWNGGEPNNEAAAPGEDCAQVEVNKHQKWNDLNCEKPLKWICEKIA